MKNLIRIVQNLGLSDKAAKVYVAALGLGEATVMQLAGRAKLKRTTVYYTIEELKKFGALKETKRNKKTYYIAESAPSMLKHAKERLERFEGSVPELEEARQTVFSRSRVYFLYGPTGFKQLWDKVFESKDKEYRMITAGERFLDYVKEKYIVNEIIKKKKALGIRSKQLISDSPLARQIIAKDSRENRVSKVLPPAYRLPFTEIITGNIVALISPKFEGQIIIIEDESFAKTRFALFELLWRSLQ